MDAPAREMLQAPPPIIAWYPHRGVSLQRLHVRIMVEDVTRMKKVLYAMHHSLSAASKRAVALALCIGMCGTSALACSTAQAPPAETAVSASTEDQSTEPILLAHHGGEAGSAALTGATAAPVMTTVKTGVSQNMSYSDSLWGNLLLGMAYQRDPELQKLARKLGRVNTFTLLSVAGVSALGMAQGISALNDIEPQSIDVTPPHHPGGSPHVHIPEESRTPARLGIIGSGATLATLGVRAVMNSRYSSKISQRQSLIQRRVDEILARLESGAETAAVEPDLTALVGPRATREFLHLWTKTYQ